MTFASRQQAGQLLGRRLAELKVQADLVLGLPRGGMVVAAEVARVLHAPLDALLVRKIGHPFHREFAVGAMAEAGVVIFDSSAPLHSEALEAVIAEEKSRLAAYERRLHIAQRPPLRGLRVILVDDGLATGATMDAAVRSARAQEADRITVAVPVASSEAVDRLERQADEVITLLSDPGFDAVGSYYEEFGQTSDEEVIHLLAQGRAATTPARRHPSGAEAA
jgi:putative phosphoribosyl transferase